MLVAEHTQEFTSPLERVFDYVTDPRNIPRWRTQTQSVTDISGPLTEGASFTLHEGRLTAPQRVLKFEPNRLYVIETVGKVPIKPLQTLTFESTPTGSSLHTRLAIECSGIFKLTQPVIGRRIRKTMVQYGRESPQRNRRLLVLRPLAGESSPCAPSRGEDSTHFDWPTL